MHFEYMYISIDVDMNVEVLNLSTIRQIQLFFLNIYVKNNNNNTIS